MSGIAGIIHFDGQPVEAGLIEGMTAAMGFRGPDGIAHWRDGSVALGQCMLHTTPESLQETQPLANADASLVLVMDGRVDNPEPLRCELLGRGARLRDRSDAELVLHAFEAWGEDCVSRIDGDFALALWNARTRSLFCARDRIGAKPFHYHWNGRSFAFASDLRPLLDLPWVQARQNEGMLAEYLAAQWYCRDETLWCGVMRLVAANRMTVDARGPRPSRYWQPDLATRLPCSTDEDYIAYYRDLLTDAVRRVSRSHRPLACEVSGGLDSSAVIAVAESLRRAARLPAPGIAGYTLGFDDPGDDAYELDFAREAAGYPGLSLHEVPASRPPLDWFDARTREDRDFAGFPNVAMFRGLREQAATDGCRVVLTGEGGDEWLGGSRAYYAEELASGRWRQWAQCLRSDVETFGVRQSLHWVLRHGVAPLLPAWSQRALRGAYRALRGSGPAARYWLSPAMRSILKTRIAHGEALPKPARARIGQAALLERLYDAFGDRVNEDNERSSARAGLELRCPLRDRRIVEFGFAIPERMRMRGERSKFVHLRALDGLLPARVRDRIDKAEFSSTFRVPLAGLENRLTRELPSLRPGWVSEPGMQRLYRYFQAHPEAGWPLWVLWSVLGCDRIPAGLIEGTAE